MGTAPTEGRSLGLNGGGAAAAVAFVKGQSELDK